MVSSTSSPKQNAQQILIILNRSQVHGRSTKVRTAIGLFTRDLRVRDKLSRPRAYINGPDRRPGDDACPYTASHWWFLQCNYAELACNHEPLRGLDGCHLVEPVVQDAAWAPRALTQDRRKHPRRARR